MWYNNPEKEILILSNSTFTDELKNRGANIHKICWSYNDYKVENKAIFAYNKNDDAFKKISERLITKIPDNSKLYFYKQSKFPRFKLQETTYKRVIKQDKADYFVIPELGLPESMGDYYVYENECAVFLVPKSIIDVYAEGNNKIFLDLLSSIDNRSNFEEEPIYIGPLYKIEKSKNYIFDLIEKFPNMNIMLDNTIDEIVNKTFQLLDENSLNTIMPMLESTDRDTVGLGLKLLANTNVIETPYLAYLLLNWSYNNWAHNSAKTTVAVAQMFNTLDFKYLGSPRPAIMAEYVFKKVNKSFNKMPTELETNLIRKYFVIPNEIKYLKKYVELDDLSVDNPFTPKITIKVE